MVPEPVFGVRASAAQVACYRRQSLLRHRGTPSPQPSPRRGEGAIQHTHNPSESVHTVNA
jgi:hypothetical protein